MHSGASKKGVLFGFFSSRALYIETVDFRLFESRRGQEIPN